MKRKTKAELESELATLRERLAELEACEAGWRQAEETQAKHSRYLEALHEITLDLINRLELADLLEKTVARAAQLMDTPDGFIYLVEPHAAELEVKVALGGYAHLVGYRLRYGEGLSGRVWQMGLPLVIKDYDTWPGRDPNYPYNIVHSIVGMPLKSGAQIVGVIGLGHREPDRTFDAIEIEQLSRFAQLASIAIDNARLFSNAQQRAERLSALNAIGQTLASTLSMEQLYRVIYQQTSRVLKVDAFYIALYEEQPELIHFPFHYDEGEYQEPTTVPLGHGPTSHVIRSRAPYVVNHPGDAVQEGGLFFGNIERHSASAMHVPMLAGDRIVGVVSVQSYQENAYGAEDLQMLQVIANQAAISVENARLYGSVQRELNERKLAEEQLQQRNRELTLLNQISQALTSTLDIDHVLVTLLGEVCKLLNVASSSVWLIDPVTRELVCRHAVGVQSQAVRGWRLAPGEGISGWVVQHGESVLMPDAQSDSRHYGGVDDASGFPVRSMLSVPLRTRDQVLGVINTVDTAADRFQRSDLTLLELVAAPAAIAIDNARLVEALRQHTIELEARNEELDAFGHTVAHDLYNPLTNIIGHTETLEMYFNIMHDQDRDSSLAAISRNARKMSNIVNELLLLAGIRKTEAESGRLDMASIVAECMSRLSDLIDQQHAQLVSPDYQTWPQAMGYAPWVEEVWVNYLSNAIKYGGRPPCVELGADLGLYPAHTPHAKVSRMVRFWVRDNGDGLAPDAQARLFTPFTRLDQIRAKGHGLGLSIVRRIVEKLGGQVGVESAGGLGRGCTFFFTLPAAD